MNSQLSQASRPKALFAAITIALTLGVSGTSQAVEATDVNCTGCVGNVDLEGGSVTTEKIADGTIGKADLANGSVTSQKIKNGTIATADLANGSVTTEKIVDGTIATVDLTDISVTSEKIAAGAVGTANLADGGVTSAKIANSAIGTAKMVNKSVTTAKIADGSVTNAKLASEVLHRIAALENEVALLKGPASYSNATLKGTYKCRELNVGTSWNATNDAAGVVYASVDSQVVADGLGTATITNGADEAETSFYVDTNKLVVTSGHTPFSDGGSLPYTVGADGKLTLDIGLATETATGWVSMNGDTVVIQFVDNDASDGDTFRSLSSCVRTAR